MNTYYFDPLVNIAEPIKATNSPMTETSNSIEFSSYKICLIASRLSRCAKLGENFVSTHPTDIKVNGEAARKTDNNILTCLSALKCSIASKPAIQILRIILAVKNIHTLTTNNARFNHLYPHVLPRKYLIKPILVVYGNRVNKDTFRLAGI